jgi:flagellar hook-associated protein 3 FlgL
MITGIDPSAEQFLTDLTRTQAKADRASRQLSSGLKFNDASDAPDQVSDILQLRADIRRNLQIGSNLQNIKTEVDTAEQAVQTAEQILERVRLLAAQGFTGLQTPEGRLAIAEEVRTLQEQLVSLSATQVGTRYVFGGDADQTAPYSLDLLNPDVGGGVVQANSAQATRQIQDPLGNTFGVDRTAQQIFDHQNPPGTPAADNVFTAVNQLRVALTANDIPGIANAMAALTQAGDYLNRQLGFYGASQNRIAAATDLSQKMDLNFQSALSGKQDADLAQVILELNQAKTQEQATLMARAQMRKTSLFDYLA